MEEKEVGRYWNENAGVWTQLARAGHDIYRDYLNTPAFFAMLPGVNGLRGIDIGCGEGHNTRKLAEQGAVMEAIDIAPVFIEKALEAEADAPLHIRYQVASATALPFPDQVFDFATSFMCLMDIPDAGKAIREAYRVLKSGGFFQFSIEHPCFKAPHLKKVVNESGRVCAFEIGDYFKDTDGKIEEWIFGDAPEDIKQKNAMFRVPEFHRTLSYWMNAVAEAGFRIEQLHEPYPDDTSLRIKPKLAGARVVAYFLHVRCRKE